MSNAVREAIIRAAQEEGIPPSLALAIAERESNFKTDARNSKTIRGAFQMTGGLRSKYGIGDSNDPYVQAKGWGKFIKDVAGEMKQGGGREFNGAELYAGHHFGGVRAGRMFAMDPRTPVDQVFTPYEMSLNPHFAKAGNVGRLLNSVTSDITRREAKFGGDYKPAEPLDFGQFAELDDTPRQPLDFSSFGVQAEDTAAGSQARPAAPAAISTAQSNAPSMQQALPDFSSMAMMG